MSAAIEITRLHKKYPQQTALHALDLRVQPGTVFGLIGPNGAGKTTALRTLVDIIRPTSGSVRVLGEDPRHGGAALRRRIGYVPGELRLEGRVSGHRMLSFYGEVSGAGGSGAAHDLADRLGVDLDRPVRTLSKGNKQKLGLIQAFMHSPELLILDEPTSGLDPLVQREFLAMLREARDAGQTVLLSSHVLSEIQQAADEVAVLANGRVVADGDVASLRLGTVRRVRAKIAAADAAAARAVFEKVTGAEELDVSPHDDGVRLSGTIEGGIDPFVKALAQYEVHELTIEEPDLEESVLRLYGENSIGRSTPTVAADAPPEQRRREGARTTSGGAGDVDTPATRRSMRDRRR